MPTLHACHAIDCRLPVPPKLFACRRHWFMLPKPLRDAVWATYRPGQEQNKQPSPDYLAAAQAAIHWLHAHEGKPGTHCVICIHGTTKQVLGSEAWTGKS